MSDLFKISVIVVSLMNLCVIQIGLSATISMTTVFFRLRANVVTQTMQQVTRRAWRRLSTDAFASDMAASELCGDLTSLGDLTTDELVQRYNEVLTVLLDQHCPIVTVRRRVNKKTTPWFDVDCRAARRRSRVAERRFKRSLSSTDYSAWSTELNKVHEGTVRTEDLDLLAERDCYLQWQ